MKFLLAVTSLASLASAEITYKYWDDRLSRVAEATSTGDLDTDTASFELGAAIAAPGSKDLILMLSSEINLLTQTLVRDENKGGKTTAEAYAGVMAHIKYCTDCSGETITPADICATDDEQEIGGDGPVVYDALPKGGIYFSSRRQTLSVDVDLDCTVDSGDACTITGYVEVELTLDTTAAHTFNFIADLQNTGTGSTNNPIRAIACFDLDAEAQAMLGTDSSASARGFVSLGKTMFIVQEASVSNLN
jgi:hypothetical protein